MTYQNTVTSFVREKIKSNIYYIIWRAVKKDESEKSFFDRGGAAHGEGKTFQGRHKLHSGIRFGEYSYNIKKK